MKTLLMKNGFLVLMLLVLSSNLYTQEYLVNIEVLGDTNDIDSVILENLTRFEQYSLVGNHTLKIGFSEQSTSIDRYELNRVNVFPNPSNDVVNIKFMSFSKGIGMISIFDLSGVLVFSGQIDYTSGTNLVEIQGLSTGFYVGNLILDNSNYTFKIKVNSSSEISRIKLRAIQTIRKMNTQNIYKSLKGVEDEVFHQIPYTEGDRFLFTAYAGQMQTIVTLNDLVDTTLVFEFHKCIDGNNNHYKTVRIGDQYWMAENLATTSYNDQSPLFYYTSDSIQENPFKPTYYWYGDDSVSYSKFGALYNWYVLDSNDVCPLGWHVPSRAEWAVLDSFVTVEYAFNGNDWNFTEAKALASVKMWKHSEGPGNIGFKVHNNNSSGLSALPTGQRDSDFIDFGELCYWWTTDTVSYDARSASYISLIYGSSSIFYNTGFKSKGMSIRCVKTE